MAKASNTFDKVIDDILVAEGGAKVTNDPADNGGRTQYGISERSTPSAWADGKVTEQEAREIYLNKYVVGPGFHRIPPSHAKLQTQLIDFGVNSGPAIAVQKLQRLLGIVVDGIFGTKTLEALIAADPRAINNRLVEARAEMICRLVQKTPSNVKFLTGWIKRALSFLH